MELLQTMTQTMMIVINTINTSLEHIQQCLAALGAYVDV
jgi:hypothetical protein